MDGRRKKTLIVDDHPVRVRELEEVLTGAGHQVLVAGTMADALTLAGYQALDLIFVGRELIDLCPCFRAERATSRVPIIVMASDGEEAECADLAFDAGATRLVAEPLEPDQIVDLLRAVGVYDSRARPPVTG